MRSAAILLLPLLCILGCGGAFAPGDASADGGADGGGAHDAAPHEGGPGDASPGPDGGPADGGTDSIAPWSPVCPATAPAVGSACATDGTQCEYGDAWWSVSCDVVVSCQGGQWQTDHPSFEACSSKPGSNPPACPSSFSAVPQGTSCTDTGLDCYYPQGECACKVPLGGPVLLDAGQQGSWGCLPEQGCPVPRPRLGSACASDGSICTYEECSYGQLCANGVWQGEEEGCAAAGGGAP